MKALVQERTGFYFRESLNASHRERASTYPFSLSLTLRQLLAQFLTITL